MWQITFKAALLDILYQYSDVAVEQNEKNNNMADSKTKNDFFFVGWICK